MRTVRDFKDFVLKNRDGCAGYEFVNLSEEHGAFWRKLNRLGARNIRSQPPETVADIDATVHLTDSEWTELEEEFRQINSWTILRRTP